MCGATYISVALHLSTPAKPLCALCEAGTAEVEGWVVVKRRGVLPGHSGGNAGGPRGNLGRGTERVLGAVVAEGVDGWAGARGDGGSWGGHQGRGPRGRTPHRRRPVGVVGCHGWPAGRLRWGASQRDRTKGKTASMMFKIHITSPKTQCQIH